MDFLTTQDAIRIKMGEVFQLQTEKFVLACSHCSEEFEYFTEFTLHVQKHLQQLWQHHAVHTAKSIDDISKNEDSISEMALLEPIDEQGTSAEIATIAEPSPIWIKSEIIDEDIEADACGMDFLSEEQIKSEVVLDDQPLDIPILWETPVEADGLSETDRYDKLIEEHHASTSTTYTSRMLNTFRVKLLPMQVTDTPEMRMLANFYMKPCKFAKLDVDGKRKVCPICNGSLTNRFIKNHIFIHSKAPLIQCPFCPEAILYPRLVWPHLRSHTNIRVECYICKAQFNEYRKLYYHIRYKHTLRMNCTQCNKEYGTSSDLNRHIKRVHQKVIETIQQPADDSHTNTIDYRLGEMPKRETSSFECYLCRKNFVSRWGLTTHMRNHLNHPALCQTCGRQFRDPALLARHMNLHTNDRSYACELCDKTYTGRRYLLEHLKKKHNLFAGATCRVCSMKFERRIDLTAHMRSAHTTVEKQFRCTVCDQSTTTIYALHKHMETHSSHQLFECPICHKKLRQVSGTQHMRSHSDNRPFECTMCDKAYKSRYALNMHKLGHDKTNQPVIECDICSKTFIIQTIYQKHRRKHPEPMPFHCKYCNVGFLTATSHHRHELIHGREHQAKQSSDP